MSASKSTAKSKQHSSAAHTKPKENSVAPSTPVYGKTLQLTVTGLDCAGCVPKVTRALGRLPSVTPLNVDFFSGIVNLRYDPESIAPDGIARFLARSTGFSVKVDSRISNSDQNCARVVLPVSFQTLPSSSVFEQMKGVVATHVSSIEKRVNLAFNASGQEARQPRDVLASLEGYGAAVVQGKDKSFDPVFQDLRDAAIRCAIAVICCIPVLVMAWAPLAPNPILYGALSVALSSVTVAVSYPILSGAVRSILVSFNIFSFKFLPSDSRF